MTSRIQQKPSVHLTFGFKWGQRNPIEAEPGETWAGCCSSLWIRAPWTFHSTARRQNFSAESQNISLILSCLFMSKPPLPSSDSEFQINTCLLLYRPQVAIYRIGTDINSIILERAHSNCWRISENYTNWQKVRNCRDLLCKSYYKWGTSEKILLVN